MQAQAVSRGYMQGPRREIHVPLPPPPTITSANQQLLQITGPPTIGGDFTKTKGSSNDNPKGQIVE
jgi:hypothetical protein